MSDAYDASAPRGTAPEWTRIYRLRGRVAHLRHPASGAVTACSDPARPALTGAGGDGWLGTGSQEEYEHAAALPLCQACFAVREASYGTEGLDPARIRGAP